MVRLMSARCPRSARSAPMARFSSRCCNVARRDLTTSDEVQRHDSNRSMQEFSCAVSLRKKNLGRGLLDLADAVGGQAHISRGLSSKRRTAFRPGGKMAHTNERLSAHSGRRKNGRGHFIEFDDFKSEFYAASTLYTALPMACRVPGVCFPLPLLSRAAVVQERDRC
jgi:hypothetical protein